MNIELPTLDQIMSYGYWEAVLVLDGKESWWLDICGAVSVEHFRKRLAIARDIKLYCNADLVYHEVQGKTVKDQRQWCYSIGGSFREQGNGFS